MKIGFISDLHCHHWSGRPNFPVNEVIESVEKEKPDLLLDAGDYERVIDWPCPYVSIPGNHDYYGFSWNEMQHVLDTKAFEFKGLKIAMTTLWTDFNKGDKFAKGVYGKALADCSAIKEFSAEIAYEMHLKHRKFLEEHVGADIIVTHHVPTFQAVHKRYKFGFAENSFEYNVNFGFASHLEDLIKELKPKIWHFGHTHDVFDFKIENTRMLCNPCGYPSEQYNIRGWDPYKPVYVKL